MRKFMDYVFVGLVIVVIVWAFATIFERLL